MVRYSLLKTCGQRCRNIVITAYFISASCKLNVETMPKFLFNYSLITIEDLLHTRAQATEKTVEVVTMSEISLIKLIINHA